MISPTTKMSPKLDNLHTRKLNALSKGCVFSCVLAKAGVIVGVCWGYIGHTPAPVNPLSPATEGYTPKAPPQLLAKNFSQKNHCYLGGTPLFLKCPFSKIFYPRFFEFFLGGTPLFLKCPWRKIFFNYLYKNQNVYE